MNLSKKLLSVTMGILLAGFLGGCSEKDEKQTVAATTVAADVAVKEAVVKLWTDSYNFEGVLTVDVKFDENALIGTKGGLTQEQAKQELELLEQLQEPNSQNILNILQGAKLTVKGAYDTNSYKTENILGINFSQNGMQVALEVPFLIDLKNDPTIFIDPKAAKALGLLPPQFDGKLVKLSVSDIPMLTDKQRASLKIESPLFEKLKKLVLSSMKNADASQFKEIAVSDAAKAAGAVRMVEVTVTPERNVKRAGETVVKFVDIATEFNLPTDEAIKTNETIMKLNKQILLFLGNKVSTFGLNAKGQIVYMTTSTSFKGAKHVGAVSNTYTITYIDKPVFTIDPTKQSSVGLVEIMKGMQP